MQPALIKGSVSDSLYVRFSESRVHVSTELHPDVILDMDENGTVVGIDLQNVTELAAEHEKLQGAAEHGRLIYQPA